MVSFLQDKIYFIFSVNILISCLNMVRECASSSIVTGAFSLSDLSIHRFPLLLTMQTSSNSSLPFLLNLPLLHLSLLQPFLLQPSATTTLSLPSSPASQHPLVISSIFFIFSHLCFSPFSAEVKEMRKEKDSDEDRKGRARSICTFAVFVILV